MVGDPEISPHCSSHPSFDRGLEIQPSWMSECKRMELESPISPAARKVIQNGSKTLRKALYCIHTSKNFLSGTQITQEISPRTDRWDHVTLRRAYTEWEPLPE